MSVELSSYNPFDHFGFTIEHHLSQFESLLELNAAWLEEHSWDLTKEVERYPQELQEEIFFDDIVTARDDFPNLTYIGLFVTLYAYIELTMKEMAIWFVDAKGRDAVRRGRISRSERIVANKGALRNRSTFRAELAMVRKLRNACNHAGSHLDPHGIRQYRSIQNNMLFSGLEVNLDSGEVRITAQFIHAAVDWARQSLLGMQEDLWHVWEDS